MTLTRRPLSDPEKRAAGSLHAALKPFFKLRGLLPGQHIMMFLHVAMDEGHDVGEYALRAGVSKSVMTRYILDLSNHMRSGEEGLGLLERRPDPTELRRHQVFLTRHGHALAHEILQAWRLAGTE